jgi:hypothetical protein
MCSLLKGVDTALARNCLISDGGAATSATYNINNINYLPSRDALRRNHKDAQLISLDTKSTISFLWRFEITRTPPFALSPFVHLAVFVLF